MDKGKGRQRTRRNISRHNNIKERFTCKVKHLAWLIERQFEEAGNMGGVDDSDSMKSCTIWTSLSSSKLTIPFELKTWWRFYLGFSSSLYRLLCSWKSCFYSRRWNLQPYKDDRWGHNRRWHYMVNIAGKL